VIPTVPANEMTKTVLMLLRMTPTMWLTYLRRR